MSTAEPPENTPPTLRRGLQVLGVVLITLSAVTPASSVFIIAPEAITQAGTGALWSFLAAGVVGVFMSFVYAELGSAYALTGGEYPIVGRVLGRLPGFMMLGLMLVSQELILAVIALGTGQYLGVLIPGLPGPATAAACVLAAAVLGIFDIKFNAAVTGTFLAIELLALAVLAALGFLAPQRSPVEVLTHPVLTAGSGLTSASLGIIIAATTVVVFAYNGYGTAVYLGEETKFAGRGIARAILWSLVITVLAELIPIAGVLVGAPDLRTLLTSPSMMSDFVSSRGGHALTAVVSGAVALAIFNAVIAILLLCGRLLFSTARDAVWPKPVNRALVAIHPRFGTPWVATLVTGIVGAGVCFVDEHALTITTGTSLIFVYIGLCVAAIVGRRNGTTAHAAYRMPLFPFAPVFVLAAMAFVLYLNLTDPVVGRPSLLVTLGVLILSAAYYLLVLRRRGTWVLRAPEGESPEEQLRSDHDA